MAAEVIGSRLPARRPRRGKLPKPDGKWVENGINYRPEVDAAQQFQTPTEEFVKRFALPASEAKAVEKWREALPKEAARIPRQPVVDAVLQVPSFFRRDGRMQWVPRTQRVVGSLDHFRQFHESASGRAKVALEENGNPFDTGGFIAGQPTSSTALIDANDYTPTLGGPYYKQLYLADYLKMHGAAFELTNHSAVAAAIVKLMYRFVVGRGVSFTIKHAGCKAVWDEYWERNDKRGQTRQEARDLTWAGESLKTWSEPKPGYLSCRLRDPSIVWEYVTDPEDIQKVYYAHIQYPTPYQVWVSGNIPVSKYVIRQIPPTQFTHMTINVSAEEKRGRSDLMPAMPYLKRLDDFYNAAVVRAMVETGMVFKIKIHGDQADVNTFAASREATLLPPPGSTWIENDAVELSTVSATLSAASRGSAGIGQQLISLAMLAVNLPSEYGNVEGSSASRATAMVRTDPAVKAIEDRQQLMRENIEDEYDRVIEAAIRAGRIPAEAGRHEPEVHDRPGQELGLGDGTDEDSYARAEFIDHDAPTRAHLIYSSLPPHSSAHGPAQAVLVGNGNGRNGSRVTRAVLTRG